LAPRFRIHERLENNQFSTELGDCFRNETEKMDKGVAILKPKHGWYFWIYGLIALVLGFVLWYNVKMMLVKEQMERYLKEEYGKEFMVKNVRYFYPYLGGNLQIRGVANPVDDPNLRFELVRDAEGSVFGNYTQYGEFPSYIYNLWAKEARIKLIKALGNQLINVSFWFEDENGELKGKTIHLNEAERIFSNRLELTVVDTRFIEESEYERNFSEFSNLFEGKLSANLAKNLYLTIEKLKVENYKKISLFVVYYNQKYKKEVEQQIYGFFERGIYDFNIPEKYLLCKFKIDNINDIAKPEDIGRYISTIVGDCYLSETTSGKHNNE